MSVALTSLVQTYLKDLTPPLQESVAQVQARAKRIKENHDKLFITIAEEINTSSRNIDGGAPDSVYLPSQKFDGGSID